MQGQVSPTTLTTSTSVKKFGSFDFAGHLCGKARYKFWAVGAILLLAFWSLFTRSVTLKWSSAGNLSLISDSPMLDNLDILEVEEQEKVVRRMWDVYSHSRFRLPRFWQEAFEAAYENLISDAPGVRNAAVSEIAKMSLRSIQPDPFPPKAQSTTKSRKSIRQKGSQDQAAASVSIR